MKVLATLLAIILMAGASIAQWSTTVMTDYYSQYIYVNGQAGYGKPVQQTDLTIGHSGGAYFGGWLSLPYDGSNSYGREVDLTAGYSWSRYDIGVMWFMLKPVGAIAGDVWYPYAKARIASLGWRAATATLWGEVDYIGSVDDPGNNGLLVQTYGKYDIDKASLPMIHTGKIGVMYDAGVFQRDASLLAFYQGDLRWDLGGGINLRAPNVKAFVPLNSSDIESDVAVGAGLTYSF